jgi:probable rRNA maturation factor
VQITIKNFQKKIPIYPKRIKKTILKILSKEGFKNSGAITVCFVNERKIKELNLEYHHKNAPTDVLAFDLSDKKIAFSDNSNVRFSVVRKVLYTFLHHKGNLSADIVVSTDAAIQNAKSFKTTPFYELNLYVIHGILHLLGYDDKNKKNSLIMHKKEKYLLLDVARNVR